MVVGKGSFVLNGEVTTYVRVSDSGQSVTAYFAQSAAALFMVS
jgi:hypothetical protein